MLSKLKMAIVYGAICGGCDVSIVNMGEKLADILDKYDIVYWSVAVDGKLDLLKSIEGIDVGVFMGGVRTSAHLEIAKLLREKSRLVVAYGSCAVYGGIPGLASLYKPEEIASIVKSTISTVSREEGSLPKELELPKLLDICHPLVDVLDPDILAPGCPPSDKICDGLADILLKYSSGWRPEGKIFLGEENTLCSNCPRKPEDLSKIIMPGIYRIHEVKIREDKCFLEQGILCMGPVTRIGCDHQCIRNNMPCIGCMGPVSSVDDSGLEMVSSIASLLHVDRERELLEKGLAKELDKIVDPIASFYRYTLPRSLLLKIALKKRGGGE